MIFSYYFPLGSLSLLFAVWPLDDRAGRVHRCPGSVTSGEASPMARPALSRLESSQGGTSLRRDVSGARPFVLLQLLGESAALLALSRRPKSAFCRIHIRATSSPPHFWGVGPFAPQPARLLSRPPGAAMSRQESQPVPHWGPHGTSFRAVFSKPPSLSALGKERHPSSCHGWGWGTPPYRGLSPSPQELLASSTAGQGFPRHLPWPEQVRDCRRQDHLHYSFCKPYLVAAR